MKESVKIFLESGLLESYLLGETNAAETSRVEAFVQKYPEVKKAFNDLQNTMEQWAKHQALTPPAGLKADILSEINKVEKPSVAKEIPLKPKRNWLAVAASVTALLLSVATLYFWSEKAAVEKENTTLLVVLKKMENELLTQQERCGILEEKFNFLNNPNTGKFILNGNNKAPEFRAIAFWNDESKQSFLNIVSLPDLPKDKCLQMWADVDGEMVNVGIISNNNLNELVSIPFKVNAESLNVTIEPAKGSDHPTVADLVSNVTI
ncbi:MAG: anti-sigma factor [Bacteroidota bacterium]